MFSSSSEGCGDDGGVGDGGGEGGGGGGGGDGGDGGGVEGGALVSTTVWVGAVTTRSPARLGTAAVILSEIIVALTPPAWACTALLWFCRVA